MSVEGGISLKGAFYILMIGISWFCVNGMIKVWIKAVLPYHILSLVVSLTYIIWILDTYWDHRWLG